MKFEINNDILKKIEIEDGDTEIVIPDGIKNLTAHFI